MLLFFLVPLVFLASISLQTGNIFDGFRLTWHVQNYADATGCDTQRYAKFFHAMLDHGVYLAPSQYEALFVGLAHDDAAIDLTIDAAAKAFKAVTG